MKPSQHMKSAFIFIAVLLVLRIPLAPQAGVKSFDASPAPDRPEFQKLPEKADSAPPPVRLAAADAPKPPTAGGSALGSGKKDQDDASASQPSNTLSEAERKEGWKLLFNGKTLEGWHNFRTNTIRPGWVVKDGALVCADPKNAGDLCTNDKFDSFELRLEYNISRAGNSGIMFHVTEEGRGGAWATGPEFQLEDNKEARDPQRCGWLYALYQPPPDPATGAPLDATKPAGEWNRVRLLVTPEKCEHAINGVKYFEYVLGSDDFNQRVAKSKFSQMPFFAKSKTGYIVLQGDHGEVSFRNIKVRPVPSRD